MHQDDGAVLGPAEIDFEHRPGGADGGREGGEAVFRQADAGAAAVGADQVKAGAVGAEEGAQAGGGLRIEGEGGGRGGLRAEAGGEAEEESGGEEGGT